MTYVNSCISDAISRHTGEKQGLQQGYSCKLRDLFVSILEEENDAEILPVDKLQ